MQEVDTWQGYWLRGVDVYDVTFDLVSATIFSTATYETYFSYHKAIWIAATDYLLYF